VNKAKHLELEFSPSKSKVMYFSTSSKIKLTKIKIGHKNLEQVEKYKYLGVTLDVKNKFEEHISNILGKIKRKIGALKFLTNKVSGCSSNVLINMYKAHIRPLIEYASIVWGGAAKVRVEPFEKMQHEFLC